MLSVTPTYNGSIPPRQPSPLPRRTDSLSLSVAKPKATSPIVLSREDIKLARVVLDSPVTSGQNTEVDEETCSRRREDRERELTEMLGRMTNWVDELATLLQQAYKNQTDLETALTLTRSNLQLALANNEMLEEALKRGGGKDVGWRRWSEREGVRRTSSVREYTQQERPSSIIEVPAQPPQSVPSRFFNFRASLQRVSSSTNTSPTSVHGSSAATSPSGDIDGNTHLASAPSLLPSASLPSSRSTTPLLPQNGTDPYALGPSRPASPSVSTAREQDLAAELRKERAAFQALSKEKSQLENELESLSQALFEEANKMVSKANRKLAETEEELRIAMEQKEALRGALRIVEGENGQLREKPEVVVGSGTPRITVSTASTPPVSASLTVTRESFWSPVSPSPTMSIVSTASSPLTATPPPKSGEHRWSIMPKTQSARTAVRDEFEQAIQRMHNLMGAEVTGGVDDEDGGNACETAVDGNLTQELQTEEFDTGVAEPAQQPSGLGTRVELSEKHRSRPPDLHSESVSQRPMTR